MRHGVFTCRTVYRTCWDCHGAVKATTSIDKKRIRYRLENIMLVLLSLKYGEIVYFIPI